MDYERSRNGGNMNIEELREMQDKVQTLIDEAITLQDRLDDLWWKIQRKTQISITKENYDKLHFEKY